MKIKVRYLSREIARSFGSSGKSDTVDFPSSAKYRDILTRFSEKLRKRGVTDERPMDALVFICNGRSLLNIENETIDANCEVIIGYADTGG